MPMPQLLEPSSSSFAEEAPLRVGRPTPTLGTRRRPERPTRGEQVARVAQALGKPFMPWQRYVADVAGEYDPDTGKPFYREVRILVPRQSGKTELVLAEGVETGLMDPRTPTNVVYTAQDRNKARKRWEDRFLADITRSPLKQLMLKPRMINGNEAIRWRNGSLFGIDAVKKDSGHGETLDKGFVDEAFAHEDSRVEAAMVPAMSTRETSQLWVLSAAGTHESVYFWEKVQSGREVAEADDPDSTIAYFEWCAPLDADPDDEDVWFECMPALGHTIDLDTVRGFRESMTDTDFRRGYLSQFAWEAKGTSPFPAAQHARCSVTKHQDEDYTPALADDQDLAVGIDTTPGRERTAVHVAGWVHDDVVWLGELVAHEPGVDWAVHYLEDLDRRRSIRRVVIDGKGQAGTLEPALKRIFGDRLLVTGPRDMARACGLTYDDTMSARGLHLDQPAVDAAVAGARKRALGGAWAVNRQDSTTDISPLVSRILARWGLADLADAAAVVPDFNLTIH